MDMLRQYVLVRRIPEFALVFDLQSLKKKLNPPEKCLAANSRNSSMSSEYAVAPLTFPSK